MSIMVQKAIVIA